jgi:hypothetical protein
VNRPKPYVSVCTPTTVCGKKTIIFVTGHFMMLHCFLTLSLRQLNLHIFDVKLLQKLCGKNMRSVLLYYSSKPDGKNKVSILDMM